MAFVMFFFGLFLFIGCGIGFLEAITATYPGTPNNPFLPVDLSADQLPLWAVAHPNGASRRTTDAAGHPLPSNTASLTVSNSGVLLMDAVLLDKLASFNRERIPERVVHAAGQGAYGHFVVTNDVSRWTKAKVFNKIGKFTKLFVRFSNTFGEVGTPDVSRDPRGFAIKFYTEDGILDFPGLVNPAFPVRDPMLFVERQRAFKRNPQTNVFDMTMSLDFSSSRPETVHNIIRSAATKIAGSMRAINGSAINVYRCINSYGEQFLCKFGWHTHQNIPTLSDLEGTALAGTEPSYYTKDLYNAIASGDYPKWTLGLQVLTEEQAKSLPFNPFDNTKVWRKDTIAFYPIGVMVLDKNPTDFFTDVEQSAFCPGNLVPGIEIEPRDSILVARAFAYKDTQRYRIGANFEQVEVNKPLSRVDSYQRDGALRNSAEDNGDGGPNFFPNSFNGPRIDPSTNVPVTPVNGLVTRTDTGQDDNFSQAKEFLEKDLDADGRHRTAAVIAAMLVEAPAPIKARFLLNLMYPLGKDFGDLVVKHLQALESGSNNVTVNMLPSYYF